jgi:hypothetical protein
MRNDISTDRQTDRRINNTKLTVADAAAFQIRLTNLRGITESCQYLYKYQQPEVLNALFLKVLLACLCLHFASLLLFSIFYWHNSAGRAVALGSTQPLKDTSTRNISWGVKAAGAWGWKLYHLHVPIILKSGNLNFLDLSGPVKACNRIALPLLLLLISY